MVDRDEMGTESIGERFADEFVRVERTIVAMEEALKATPADAGRILGFLRNFLPSVLKRSLQLTLTVNDEATRSGLVADSAMLHAERTLAGETLSRLVPVILEMATEIAAIRHLLDAANRLPALTEQAAEILGPLAELYAEQAEDGEMQDDEAAPVEPTGESTVLAFPGTEPAPS